MSHCVTFGWWRHLAFVSEIRGSIMAAATTRCFWVSSYNPLPSFLLNLPGTWKKRSSQAVCCPDQVSREIEKSTHLSIDSSQSRLVVKKLQDLFLGIIKEETKKKWTLILLYLFFCSLSVICSSGIKESIKPQHCAHHMKCFRQLSWRLVSIGR